MANKIPALWSESDQRFAFGISGAGAVQITKEQLAELMAGQGQGKMIRRSSEGLPVLIDPPIHVPTADDHRAAIAAERYRKETAGIILSGMHIDTGRDSQALITGATVQAMLDPSYVLRWKTVHGFVELTAEQIIGVASAARAHVQACFDREAELLQALNDGTYKEAMLEEGWPNEQVSAPVAG